MKILRPSTLLLSLAGALCAQLPSGVIISSGYLQVKNPVTVAPEQIVNFSVLGLLSADFGPPATREGTASYVTEYNGLRAVVRDGSREWPAGMVGGKQANCAQTSLGCEPVMALTLQMPHDIEAGGSPVLTVFNNNAELASIPLRVTSDQLHILNSCDETAVFVGLFSDSVTGSCRFAVTHANGRLVTAQSPASYAETLVLWVFGAGASNGNALTYAPQVWFDYRPNAPASRQPYGTGPSGNTRSSVVYGRTGLTQINFTVPPPPQGTSVRTCNDSDIRSNLTVTVFGPASQDSARICVAPISVIHLEPELELPRVER